MPKSDPRRGSCEAIFADEALAAGQKLRAVITQLMSAYDQYYPHMYVYIQEEMSRVTSEKSAWAQRIVAKTRTFERIVLSLISELIKKGEMRDDIAVSVAANAVFGMLNWTHRWYQPGGAHSAPEVSNAFCEIWKSADQSRARSARLSTLVADIGHSPSFTKNTARGTL